MSTLAPIADKLSKLVRMLTSDQDGEVVAAARSINRTLKNAGLDIHVLAAAIERGNVASGTPNAPAWHSVACECAAHPERLRSEKRTRFRGRHGGLDQIPRRANRAAGAMAALDLLAGALMTEKPNTFCGDLAHLPQALLPLTEQNVG